VHLRISPPVPPFFTSQHAAEITNLWMDTIYERGRRMGVGAVEYLVKKDLCFADREDLSANDLRNHFAMEFYKRSGKLTATQKVLGHRNVNTTRYTRATDRDIQESIDALDP